MSVPKSNPRRAGRVGICVPEVKEARWEVSSWRLDFVVTRGKEGERSRFDLGPGQARVQGLRIIVRIVLTASVNCAFTVCQALYFVLIFVLFYIIFIL